MRRRGPCTWLLAACAAWTLSACGGSETMPAAALGARLASDPHFSSSASNLFACTTCHSTSEDDGRILPGHTLVGAARRPSFWGGNEPDLEGAVDACLLYFMNGAKLDPESPDARALFEYLVLLGGDEAQPALPFSLVVEAGQAPPRGDPARGAEVHRLACQGCHGAAHTGVGRLTDKAPILPDQARDEAADLFPGEPPANVFTEKVRHGPFLGVGGSMPPFSRDVLSDEDLGALLAYYDL